MEKRHILFIFSLLLAFVSISQEQGEDSTKVVRSIIPSIYIDYGKLFTIPTDFETKYEGGVEILLKEKFPIIIEVGSVTTSPTNAFSNGIYESTGMYYRIGTGIYSQFQVKNKIGLSMRYAFSSFDETRRITIESPSSTQSTFVESIENKNLTANWLEVVLYSDRNLNDFLSIGINLRLRVLISYDEQSPIDIYAIPGYGRSFDNSVPAANLFLKVSF